MAWSDPDTTHVPAANLAIPAVWGLMVNNDLDLLYERQPRLYYPAAVMSGIDATSTTEVVATTVNNGMYAHIHWWMPSDYGSLISALLIMRHASSVTYSGSRRNIYGTEGEAYNNHDESTTSNISLTTNWLFADVSSIFSNLGAKDAGTLHVQGHSSGAMSIKGLILDYERA